MATPTHHTTRSLLPAIADLFSTIPAVGMLRPSGHLIRVEEELDDVKAGYRDGILTVTVPLTAPSNPGKQIKIESS
ncbi:Hsp20 family protein [Gordonia amicalis]|uniref:Hsp20 family protein n=1 Tax=Gordonia amicalis TaxID=89053 RepID=UPI0004144991|nr:Hsp20 family protein [Gordonia amicalis]